MSGLAGAVLRSQITTRLQLQSLPKTLTQPVNKLHRHANIMSYCYYGKRSREVEGKWRGKHKTTVISFLERLW